MNINWLESLEVKKTTCLQDWLENYVFPSSCKSITMRMTGWVEDYNADFCDRETKAEVIVVVVIIVLYCNVLSL